MPASSVLGLPPIWAWCSGFGWHGHLSGMSSSFSTAISRSSGRVSSLNTCRPLCTAILYRLWKKWEELSWDAAEHGRRKMFKASLHALHASPRKRKQVQHLMPVG